MVRRINLERCLENFPGKNIDRNRESFLSRLVLKTLRNPV